MSIPIRIVLVGLFGLGSGPLFAQSVAPRADENSARAERGAASAVVELSPFVVSSEQNKGYYAPDTLAGTRLNTSLQETPAAISTFTRSFIDDIAATNGLDVLEYGINAKPDYEESANNFNGNTFNGTTPAGITIRGLPGGKRTLNYFELLTEIDTYNADRLDFSRGPNSILFGVGPAAGVLNTTTKMADTSARRAEVRFRADNLGSYRVSVDDNQLLVKNRLAVRVNLLKDEGRTWRNFEYNRQERIDLAATWRIDANTTLRAEGEIANVRNANSRPWIGLDRYSSGNTAYGAPEIEIGADGVGTVYDYRTFRRSNGTGSLIQDFSLVPKENVLEGHFIEGGKKNFRTYSVFLERRLPGGFSGEVAYNRQTLDAVSPQAEGASLGLFQDISTTLPGRSGPNPYQGSYFLMNRRFLQTQKEAVDSLRTVLSYDKKFGDWVHVQSAGLFERRDDNLSGQNMDELLFDGSDSTIANLAFAKGNPVSALNQARYLYRLPASALGTNNIFMPQITQTGTAKYIPQAGQAQTLYTRYVPRNAAQILDSRKTQSSWMAATKIDFLKNRIHFTGGVRKEGLDYYAPQTGVYANGIPYLINVSSSPSRTFDGYARSYGFVANVNKWLSAFYNRSTSFDITLGNDRVLNSDPDSPDQTLIPPNRRGETKDYGIKLKLLQGRMFATLTRYDTQARQNTDPGIAAARFDVQNIWIALHDAGKLGNATVPSVDATTALIDQKTSGYEAEIIANPTTRWRLMANYAYTDVARTNQAKEWRAYLDRHKTDWLAGGNGALNLVQSGTTAGGDHTNDAYDFNPITRTGTIDTIREAVAQAEELLYENYTIFEGLPPRGVTKHSFNFRTNYTFGRGVLHGFAVGGGARIRLGRVIDAFAATSTGTPPVDQFTDINNGRQVGSVTIVRGGTETLADLNLSYNRKLFSGRVNFTGQLNIINVFNHTDFIVTQLNADYSVRRYRFVDPRKLVLTATFAF